MRPQDEWFKPEQLRRYYFAYEAIGLAIVAVVVALAAVSGVLWAVQPWVLAVAGVALLVAFGYLTWWVPAFCRTAAYRFTDDEIDFRRGVFFRQKTTVPYNRITNVDATQGPIQRLVGAGSVGVHTAGYGGQMGAELTVDGVHDFEEIKDQILDRVRERPARATEGKESPPVGRAADVGDASGQVLAELRRIRELLERGRVV